MQDATLLQNVRLWGMHAFNATITQIQALRPYYAFPETDVDRYFINGRIKQVLLSPRELDVTQLSAEASQSWINPHFIYTHGIGAVVAEVDYSREVNQHPATALAPPLGRKTPIWCS